MQEMTYPVHDFEFGARCGQVVRRMAEYVDAECSVIGAMEIQRWHRRIQQCRQRFGRRIRVGEIRVERRAIGSDDVGDVVRGDVSTQFSDVFVGSYPGDQSAHSDSQKPGSRSTDSGSPTCWMSQM